MISIHPNNLISGRLLRPHIPTGVGYMLCRSYVRDNCCDIGLDLKPESLDQCHKADTESSWRCSNTAEGVNVYVLRDAEQIL